MAKKITKKVLMLLLVLVASICIALCFTACGSDGESGSKLDYTLSDDGTYYVVAGMGTSTNTDVVISDTYNELPVTRIKSYAFQNKAITSITIPDSVTSIGTHAFYGCNTLTSITIGNGIEEIDELAFGNCKSLDAVYITDVTAWCRLSFSDDSDSPLEYAEKLYLNDELLTNLVIPDGVTYIGRKAFDNCKSLTSVTIPDSVTSIYDYAFYNCTSLSTISVGNGITSWGAYAIYNTAYFNDSNNWEDNVLYLDNALIYANRSVSSSYTVKDETTIIANCAFYSGNNLTSLVICDSVAYIGEQAFRECSRLQKVTIGSGVIFIDSYAFYRCSSLTSVTFNETSGWYVTETIGETSGTNVNVTSASTNASNLLSTYLTYYWYKN